MDKVRKRKFKTFKDRVPAPRANLEAGSVTGLEPQARRPNRFNLYVDNHFALGLSAYVARAVRVGQEIFAEELQALARAEALEDAHERALRALESRPRSAQEIRQKLIGKKIPNDVIDEVVKRLNEARLLSDRDFAKFWVETREGFKPRSARALKYELRQKGVSNEDIARAVKKVDEHDSAYRAAQPKAERWKNLEARAFRDKLSGFLARRGFDYAVTRDTVNKIWKELQGEEVTDNEVWE